MNAKTSTPFASLWRRLAAAVFDTCLGFTIALAITFIFGVVLGTPGLFSAIAMSALLWWLYSAGMESSDLQTTLGGRIFSLRVTTLQGGRAGFWRASVRQLIRIALFLAVFAAEESGNRYVLLAACALPLVGFLIALALPRKQALFDLAARTVVIQH